VFAADDSIFYADSLDLGVEISSKINIVETSSSSSIDYIKANLTFFPEETWRQEIKSIETAPQAEINDAYILYSWSSPEENQLELSVTSDIRTYNKFKQVKSKVRFPIENIEKENIIYTKPSEKIDINDEIIQLAASLAEGEDDLYIVEVNLAEWVNKNIKYDLNTLTAEASQKSSWVLENKEGVCDEITNLFISMNRALGIPARFVSGISYSNSPLFENSWGPHGWAEVYFPDYGWIPFDVTYSEYGYIDAGHIQCDEGVDSEKSTINY
jgi:transglutaminase-like putative cysteine protease